MSKTNNGALFRDDCAVTSLEELPVETTRVLATCHSLVQMESELVGDPLEKACLLAVDWVLTKSIVSFATYMYTTLKIISPRCLLSGFVTDDAVIPRKGKEVPLKIFTRHHFSSNLKRMSVVAGYMPTGTSVVNYIVAVKGAPETLKHMVNEHCVIYINCMYIFPVQFTKIPENYDRVYRQMTREGARVLALGYKYLGPLSHQQVIV